MNDEKIKKWLENSDLPPLQDSARQRIVKASLARFRQVEIDSFEKTRLSFGATLTYGLGSIWKPAVALTACALVFALVHTQKTEQQARQMNDLKYEIATLKEYQRLFPKELKALVNRQDQVDLVLGGDGFLQANPTVVIDFTNQGERVRVVGFSGQSLAFNLGGQEIQVDVLLNKENQVLLVGKDFVWEEQQANGIHGYQVATQVVGVHS